MYVPWVAAMDTPINPLDEKQQVFHSLTQILPETHLAIVLSDSANSVHRNH